MRVPRMTPPPPPSDPAELVSWAEEMYAAFMRQQKWIFEELMPQIRDVWEWWYPRFDVDQKTTYTVTNLTTDRDYDADASSVATNADVLGTLIDDLGLKG